MWDWELMNDIKPIWTRPAREVEEEEYKAFYKTFSKVSQPPLDPEYWGWVSPATYPTIRYTS